MAKKHVLDSAIGKPLFFQKTNVLGTSPSYRPIFSSFCFVSERSLLVQLQYVLRNDLPVRPAETITTFRKQLKFFLNNAIVLPCYQYC